MAKHKAANAQYCAQQPQTDSPSKRVSKWIDEKSSLIVERPGRDASEPATSVTWREYKAPY